MRRERPASVTVVAILQIVFGSIGLLGNLCGGAFQLAGGNKAFMPAGSPQAAQQQKMQDDIEAVMKEKVPYYEAMKYGGPVLGLVSGTVMVASGIGLLKVRPWARWLTVGYACYFVVSTLLSFVFALIYTGPLMKELMDKQGAAMPPGAAPMMGCITSMTEVMVYAQLLYLVYPAVLLAIMFLPGVRAAFRGEQQDDPEEGAAYDFPDDDREGEEGAADTPREEGIKPDDEAEER